MAYIVKDARGRSPFWTAVYFTATGRRLKKTTKIRIVPLKGDLNESGKQRTAPENRRAALAFAEDLERTEKLAGLGQLTEAKARTIISSILERATGNPLQHHSVRSWLNMWLEGKRGAVAEKTFAKYEQVVKQFLAFLKGRAEINVAAVSPADITGFRDQLLSEKRTPQTVNQLVRKTLSPIFEQARKLGFVPVNPCAAVPALKAEKTERDVFSLEEITRLVAAAEGDWKGAILIGYYTGARLRDVTNLRWTNCDLTTKVIRFRQTKTGKAIVAPMHPAIEEWLLVQPAAGDPKAPVFPKLAVGEPAVHMGSRVASKRSWKKPVSVPRPSEKEKEKVALRAHGVSTASDTASTVHWQMRVWIGSYAKNLPATLPKR